jgi:hypothetical protein
VVTNAVPFTATTGSRRWLASSGPLSGPDPCPDRTDQGLIAEVENAIAFKHVRLKIHCAIALHDRMGVLVMPVPSVARTMASTGALAAASQAIYSLPVDKVLGQQTVDKEPDNLRTHVRQAH